MRHAATSSHGEIATARPVDGRGDPFKSALVNLGVDLTYLDVAAFAKFQDDDIKRVEKAVQAIGKVES